MRDCTICLEELDEAFFSCPTSACQYQICKDCVQLAVEDPTGGSFDECQLCKVPIGQLIMELLCGKGLVRAVERELRPKIEYDVRMDHIRKERGREEMVGFEGRARLLFQNLCELLNMKCPKCKMAFADYEGCNALKCGNSNCSAAFCAICLQDCGRDAHEHVRSQHGNLFDKEAFYKAKRQRETTIVSKFIENITDEPFEIKELVKIHYEKTLPESKLSHRNSNAGLRFLEGAKIALVSSLRNDRLSILNEPKRQPLRYDDISPRNAVPTEYKLSLTSTGSAICRISLRQFVKGEWVLIPLPNDETPKGQENVSPTVDSLINIQSSITCAVIAFQGKRSIYQSWTVPYETKDNNKKIQDNEVSIKFQRISDDGNLVGELETLAEVAGYEVDIIGINPNRRWTLLERHVRESKPMELLFDSLRHFVGEGVPNRLFRQISVPPPDTFKDLNENQKKVAHPLSLTTAMEVVGPPGSGKTKTITELIRSILECTDHDVIVLSERNGAIDAIADKFADECLSRSANNTLKITDVPLWLNVLSFGSRGAMGSSTKLFTIDSKIKYHPELLELERLLQIEIAKSRELKKRMLQKLAKAIGDLVDDFPTYTCWKRVQLINKGDESGLSRATEVVVTIKNALTAMEVFCRKELSGCDSEDDIKNLVLEHSSLLGNIFPLREEEEKKLYSWPKYKKDTRIIPALSNLVSSFRNLLDSETFSLENAEDIQLSIRNAESALTIAGERIKNELLINPRVLMSTIGSYHKIPIQGGDTDEDGGTLLKEFAAINMDDKNGKRKTLVIFDEAGCIPMYELLGLSRLGRDIEGLVCVGDKNQLPPYNPSSARKASQKKLHKFAKEQKVNDDKIKSLLDASALQMESGKVKLTTQYRVPRDIANLLDDRIYKGDYKTAPECAVPLKGFHFIDVFDSGRGEKYVNLEEVEQCFLLVQKSLRDGFEKNIMVLTPYKKQQRRLEFTFQRKGEEYSKIPILTIDQCQGQEADIVIISLVQKPTMFLTKNRMNVALSRVRQKLYFLADRKKFEAASQNPSWECAQIAKDLLKLHHH